MKESEMEHIAKSIIEKKLGKKITDEQYQRLLAMGKEIFNNQKKAYQDTLTKIDKMGTESENKNG